MKSIPPLSFKEPVLSGETDLLFTKDVYPKSFAFDAEVAAVFDNMISRSVPLYREVMEAICEWVFYFYQEGSCIYDIGCSTGTLIEMLLKNMPFPMKLIGIDTSLPMIERAKLKLSLHISNHNQKSEVAFLHQDARNVSFMPSSVVMVSYTLQFLPVPSRLRLLKNIKDALLPGGVLILSDKLRSQKPELEEVTSYVYERFKRRSGYSQTEIERKKESLDQVLVPFTFEEEMSLLKDAGFSYVEPMIRWNNFCTFLAF